MNCLKQIFDVIFCDIKKRCTERIITLLCLLLLVVFIGFCKENSLPVRQIERIDEDHHGKLENHLKTHSETVNKEWFTAFCGDGEITFKDAVLGNQNKIYVVGGFVGKSNTYCKADATGAVLLEGGYVFSKNRSVDAIFQGYNESGEVIWTRVFGGAGFEEATAVDRNNEMVFIGGRFSEFVALDGLNVKLESKGGSDSFVMAINNEGDYLWSVGWGGRGDDKVLDVIAGNHGDVYVIGKTNSLATKMGDFGLDKKCSKGGIFVSKIHRNGTIGWSRMFCKSPGYYHAYGVVDPTGNIAVCASVYDYSKTRDTSTIRLGKVRASTDVFLAALDDDGQTIWTKYLGGDSDEYCSGIEVGRNDRIFVYGVAPFDIDLDPGPGEKTYNIDSDYGNAFVVEMSWQGDFVNARTINGRYTDIDDLKVLKNGEVIIWGRYQGDKVGGNVVRDNYILGNGISFYVAHLDKEFSVPLGDG